MVKGFLIYKCSIIYGIYNALIFTDLQCKKFFFIFENYKILHNIVDYVVHLPVRSTKTTSLCYDLIIN